MRACLRECTQRRVAAVASHAFLCPSRVQQPSPPNYDKNRGKAIVDPEMARFHDTDSVHDKGYLYLFFTSEKVMIVENDVDRGEGSHLEG